MAGEIERWQHTVSRDVGSGAVSSRHDGLASRLSTAACELFLLLLSHARSQISKKTFRKLEREYGYLKLWCDGYGATSGDLDVAISESTRLRHATYRLLVSVCHNLADKLTFVLLPVVAEALRPKLKEKAAQTRDLLDVAAIHSADGSDSESDSENDSSSVSGDTMVEDIIADIRTDIQCLVDLGPRYREPIRDRTVKEQAVQPSPVTKWDPAEHLASRIRHRYPKGDVALARILGQTNWDRFKRLKASKEANAQAAERPAAKPEAASGAPGTVVASDFHDSGLGTSVATPSSYAETVLSYHGTKGGSIKIPQVPAEGLGGKPFVCDICGCICQLPGVNWKSFWKKHVLSDLQPYACVMTDCRFSLVPFSHKSAWILHLEFEHGFASVFKDLACLLCHETIHRGQVMHLARHLEEVALTILPANAESDEEHEFDEGSGEEPESDQEADLPEAPSPPLHAGGAAIVDSANPPVSESDGSNSDHDRPARIRIPRRKGVKRFDAVALVDLVGGSLPLTRGQALWIWAVSAETTNTPVLAECKETGRRGYVLRPYVGVAGSKMTEPDSGAWPAEDQAAINPVHMESAEADKNVTARPARSSTGVNQDEDISVTASAPPEGPANATQLWQMQQQRLEILQKQQQRRAELMSKHGLSTIMKGFSSPEPTGVDVSKMEPGISPGNFVLFEGRRDDLVYFPPLSKTAELEEEESADGPGSEKMAAPLTPNRARTPNQQQHGQHLPVSLTSTVPGTSYHQDPRQLSEFHGDLSTTGADEMPIPRYDPYSVSSTPPLQIQTAGTATSELEDEVLPSEHRESWGLWTPWDDQTLLKLRSMGKTWTQIQMEGFAGKTANACRKRHERLMEKREGLTESGERFKIKYSDRGPD